MGRCHILTDHRDFKQTSNFSVTRPPRPSRHTERKDACLILLNQTDFGTICWLQVRRDKTSSVYWAAEYSKQVDQLCPHEVQTGAADIIIKSQLLLQATWIQAFRSPKPKN